MEFTPSRFETAIRPYADNQPQTEAGRSFQAAFQAAQQAPATSIDWRKDGFDSGADIVFYGRPEDYKISFRKGEGTENYYIRRVGNDGFDADIKGKSGIPGGQEIKLDPNRNIVFLNRSTNRDNAVTFGSADLKDLSNERRGNARYSTTNEDISGTEKTSTNSLYRNRFNENDYVLGGAGNDQFRVGAKGLGKGGDFFDGGDGNDTVYLPGVASDYTFQRNTDYQVTIIENKTGDKMDIESVERIRFSGGGGKKGYRSVDSLAPQ